MIIRGLKATFFLNLVIILMLAMILINVVITNTLQRDLVKAEIQRARRLTGEIGAGAERYLQPDGFATLASMLKIQGITAIFIHLEPDGTEYTFNDSDNPIGDLESFARMTGERGSEAIEFRGSGWGIFWKQGQELWIASPLDTIQGDIGFMAMVLPLEKTYLPLRRAQRIIFLYIAGNAILFSLIGLLGLVKIVLQPVQKLARRVENYETDDPMWGIPDLSQNEFGKLSRALRGMMKRIAEDKETLKTYIQSLENTNRELKHAQSEIIKAEKMASIGRLSAGIAHEIGNPIGIVLGYLNLLKQEAFSASEKQEFIKRAESEITRVNAIIRQLLDFARGTGKTQPQRVSLAQMVQEVCKLMQYQPVMRGIEIECRFRATADEILADPDQVRQLLLNLLINAADAISSSDRETGGQVRIEVDRVSEPGPIPAPALQVVLTDNGHGICRQNLDLIFDPFFTTKAPGKGTGLGLTVCFMIVDGMGGRIEAESQEGEGTRMKVYLPASTAAAAGNEKDSKRRLSGGEPAN